MALGWWVDEILVYVIRTIIRLIAELRSRSWPINCATLQKAESYEALVFYPEATVTYKYTVDGEDYSGRHTRGFFFRASARTYAEKFVASEKFVVRYNPKNPAKSIVRSGDLENRSLAAAHEPDNL